MYGDRKYGLYSMKTITPMECPHNSQKQTCVCVCVKAVKKMFFIVEPVVKDNEHTSFRLKAMA